MFPILLIIQRPGPHSVLNWQTWPSQTQTSQSHALLCHVISILFLEPADNPLPYKTAAPPPLSGINSLSATTTLNSILNLGPDRKDITSTKKKEWNFVALLR